MKSITLHKLDPALARALEERARSRNQSLNRTSQELLRTALGLDSRETSDLTEAFLDLFGCWTEADLAEFNANVLDLNTVDRSDWEA